MLRTGIFRGIVWVLLWSVAASAAHAAAGRSPAVFNVSNNGAATYALPIWMQPGPRGMQPTIALTYNSQQDNGILGVGWALSGLSSIDRCPKSEAQDGASASVMGTSNDVFCLDGNRLRRTSGTYGAPGSTYATEVADYSVITAEGSAGSGNQAGPESFTVVAKSGLTYEYGKTADSRLTYYSGAPVMRWLVNKVRDASGNSYTIEYQTTTNVPVPVRMTWGAANQYSAVFTYVDKIPGRDWLAWYVAGFQSLSSKRLERIRIQHNSTTERQYVMTYDIAPVTSRSRLREVKECGESDSDCLAPVLITYQAGQAVMPNAASRSLVGANMVGAADFNGDRKEDLVYTVGSEWYVMFGNNGGFGATVPVTGMSGTLGQSVDYDNFLPGGRAAFITVEGGDLFTYSAVDSNSDGLVEQFVRAPSGLTGVTFPDGRVPTGVGKDIVWVGPTSQGSWRIRRARNITTPTAVSPRFETNDELGGSSLPTNVTIGGTPATVTASSTYIVGGQGLERRDYNGDGYEELYLHLSVSYGAGGEELLAAVHAEGLYIDHPTNWTSWSQQPLPAAIRFNHDRCTDTVDSSMGISGCGGAGNFVSPPSSAPAKGWIDWDGDGLMDQLVDNGGTLGIYPSTGTGFGSLITTAISSAGRFLTMDLDGDGLDDIVGLEGAGSSTSFRYHTHAADPSVAILYATEIPDLADTITDGLGVQYRLDYVSTAQHNYIEASPPPSPLVRSEDPVIVVARAHITDGAGGTYIREFTYVGAAKDPTRGVSAGFLEQHETDSRTGVLTKTSFEQMFPKTGRVRHAEAWRDNGTEPKLLGKTETIYHEPVAMLDSTPNNQRYLPYLDRVTRDRYEASGPQRLVLTTTTEYQSYNLDNGEPRTVASTLTSYDNVASGTWTSTITTDYFQPTTGCLNLPMTVTRVQQAPGQPSITRTVDYTPDGANCRHRTQTIHGTNSNLDATTTYDYDGAGNIRSVREDAKEPNEQGLYLPAPPREATLTWTDTSAEKSITISRKVNDTFSETSRLEYYPGTGLLRRQIDPNQRSVQWEYDEFGRQTKITRPDSTSTTFEYTECGSNCLSGGQHVMTATQTDLNPGGAVVTDQKTYLDRYERPLVTRVRQLGGNYLWREFRYNAQGQLSRSSVPCVTDQTTASCASSWSEQLYDLVGRIETVRTPGEGGAIRTTSYSYAGLRTTLTDPLNKVSSKVVDMAGRLYRSTDANQYTQDFTYDSEGSLTRVSDPWKTLFEVAYDYGAGALQTSAKSYAQTSATAYLHDGFGQLRRWTDAKGQTFEMSYDGLSRPLTRRDGIVNSTQQETLTRWIWGSDAGARDIGLLTQLSSASIDGTYREVYGYTGAGRMQTQTIQLPGDATDYVYNFVYDPDTGAIDTLTYPASTGTPFALKYDYAGGILQRVRDPEAGTEFWALHGPTPLNAFGRITGERFGNGVVRTRDFDPVTGWVEKITAGPAGNDTALQNSGYLYDPAGNLTQRQNNLGSLPEPLSEDFTNSSDPLYRFRTGSVNGALMLDIQEYDELGNIRRKNDNSGLDAPIDYTVAWTSYNLPGSIDSPAMGESVSFAYGPNRNRWRMVYQDSAAGRTETTYYLGGLMEKVVIAQGGSTTTEYRHYIRANEPVAIHSRVVAGANTTRYLLDDHLGSIDTIVDSAGNAIVNRSYAPFGMPRDPGDWIGLPSSSGEYITRQGYTFHTVLGRLGLNHMNGRVQDAITGQFLSPDPFVAAPGNTQSWNRYAYVYNNPLSLIDPSGFFGCMEDDLMWWSSDVSGIVTSRPPGMEGPTVTAPRLRPCTPMEDPLPDYSELWTVDDLGGASSPDIPIPMPELAPIDVYSACDAFAAHMTQKTQRKEDLNKLREALQAADMSLTVTEAILAHAADLPLDSKLVGVQNASTWVWTHPSYGLIGPVMPSHGNPLLNSAIRETAGGAARYVAPVAIGTDVFQVVYEASSGNWDKAGYNAVDAMVGLALVKRFGAKLGGLLEVGYKVGGGSEAVGKALTPAALLRACSLENGTWIP